MEKNSFLLPSDDSERTDTSRKHISSFSFPLFPMSDGRNCFSIPKHTLVACFDKGQGWILAELYEIRGNDVYVIDLDDDNKKKIKVNVKDVYLYPSNTETLPPPGELVLAPWYDGTKGKPWTTALYYAYVVDYFSKETIDKIDKESGIPMRGIDSFYFHSVLSKLQSKNIMVRLRYYGDSGLFVIPSRFLFRVPLDKKFLYKQAKNDNEEVKKD